MSRNILSILVIICITTIQVNAQISLAQCKAKARANYPAIEQFDLIQKTESFNISNLIKAYLPQISIYGKVTYQSDVSSLPIQIPGMTVKALNQDQYQIIAELSQIIWDGGAISAQKTITAANTKLENSKLEVELYGLNERINQLFFSILFLDAQIGQNAIFQKELNTNYEKINVFVQNGIANQTDLDLIRVELLNNKQKRIELMHNHLIFID